MKLFCLIDLQYFSPNWLINKTNLDSLYYLHKYSSMNQRASRVSPNL
uniref:Uncharacterized protein n=1 Tax=Podoviridae sp. ct8Lf7 TaxID=2827723 RepID=A0A8S5S042_9CAUD|nr:MAG TPA: hypothetical protein [Podoviridae sp. ct8Lf7]